MKKNNSIWIYQLILLGVAILHINGCEENEEPSVETGTLSDIDGNTYNTVKIGEQWWMAENLKATHYSDGTDIPNITDQEAWTRLSTPGYCWYENSIDNKTNYGALYNWSAAVNGDWRSTSRKNRVQGVCPTGWHLPSMNEVRQLQDYLRYRVAGGKLKEAGTTHWVSPNEGATNEFGFTALPGGSVSNEGRFSGIGSIGNWWSSSAAALYVGNVWTMSSHNKEIGWNTYEQEYGFSVRCVKD